MLSARPARPPWSTGPGNKTGPEDVKEVRARARQPAFEALPLAKHPASPRSSVPVGRGVLLKVEAFMAVSPANIYEGRR